MTMMLFLVAALLFPYWFIVAMPARKSTLIWSFVLGGLISIPYIDFYRCRVNGCDLGPFGGLDEYLCLLAVLSG